MNTSKACINNIEVRQGLGRNESVAAKSPIPELWTNRYLIVHGNADFLHVHYDGIDSNDHERALISNKLGKLGGRGLVAKSNTGFNAQVRSQTASNMP